MDFFFHEGSIQEPPAPPVGMSGVCLTGFPVHRAQGKQSHVDSRQRSEAAVPLRRKGGGFPQMLQQHLVHSRTSVSMLRCGGGGDRWIKTQNT